MSVKEAFESYVNQVTGLCGEFAEGASDGDIKELCEVISGKGVEELVELLKLANGEREGNAEMAPIAGLYLLSSKRIISEADYFSTCGISFTSIGTDAIMEEDSEDRKWIPFAFDCSSCFFAVDLTPTSTGKVGQVIALDIDYDQCYLVANSISDMFEKFAKWYKEGDLLIEEDGSNKYITSKEGHVFNYLDKIAVGGSGDGSLIELDDFWKDYYSGKLVEKDGKFYVDLGVLSSEKRLFIKEKSLSCGILEYMDNLKEVILHNCKIKNLSGMAKAPVLQKVIFANCEIVDGDLSDLASSPKLKSLGLNVMSGKGLDKLSGIKALKSLGLREISDISENDIAGFKKLQELEIESMEIGDVSFISDMKGIKILGLGSMELDNLDFLANLSKLTEFTLAKKAKDESGLLKIKDMPKLISFEYPVSDISIYKACPSITSVGFAPEVEKNGDFSVFDGSKVSSFTVCGSTDDKLLDKIYKKMKKYTNIFSYSGRE